MFKFFALYSEDYQVGNTLFANTDFNIHYSSKEERARGVRKNNISAGWGTPALY